jgi:hypothetical protein
MTIQEGQDRKEKTRRIRQEHKTRSKIHRKTKQEREERNEKTGRTRQEEQGRKE